jgi:hypothetical protein
MSVLLVEISGIRAKQTENLLSSRGGRNAKVRILRANGSERGMLRRVTLT